MIDTRDTEITRRNTEITRRNTETSGVKTFVLAVVFTSFVLSVASVFSVTSVFSYAQYPARIISLVPALTEMLFAIGAGPQVIGVSSYDEFPPEVKSLPQVGALLDPDVERILALRPDLVLTYGSQLDLQTQMKRASIATYDYRHGGLAHILVTMRELGDRTGHAREAASVISTIESRIAAVEARVGSKRRPRTLLVFGREPATLRNIYVSAGRGFLHDMLEAAGGDDVFADVQRESIQATTETILARAPEVILEIRSQDGPTGASLDAEYRAWGRLSSLPAVRNKRVHFLTGQQMTVPGPRVADGVERMAAALHP